MWPGRGGLESWPHTCVLGWVPQGRDPEMEICEQEVDGGVFSDQHLSGSKGSRTQQRERVSCPQLQRRSQPQGALDLGGPVRGALLSGRGGEAFVPPRQPATGCSLLLRRHELPCGGSILQGHVSGGGWGPTCSPIANNTPGSWGMSPSALRHTPPSAAAGGEALGSQLVATGATWTA